MNVSRVLDSINFLFLLALAAITWVILCYFKHLEDQRTEDFNIEFQLGHGHAGGEAYLDDDDMSQSGSDSFDIGLNFLCIFSCIYMLTKFTQASERFVGKFMQDKLKKATSGRYNSWPYMKGDHSPPPQQKQPDHPPTKPPPPAHPPKTAKYGSGKKEPCPCPCQPIDPLRAKQAALEEHILFLERQNVELKKELRHMSNVVALSTAAPPKAEQGCHQCLKLALNEFAVLEHSRIRERLAQRIGDHPSDGPPATQPFAVKKPLPVQVQVPRAKVVAPLSIVTSTMTSMRFSNPMPEKCAINFEAQPVGGECVVQDTADLLNERFGWHG